MDEFERNSKTVIDTLEQRGYSQRTIQNHKKVYQALYNYLDQNQIPYTPSLGNRIISDQKSILVVKGDPLLAGCISKLNDVYLHGRIVCAQMSPHKDYTSLTLSAEFEQAVSNFMNFCSDSFSDTQIYNAKRRCSLFLRCMQYWGRETLLDITYDEVYKYHHLEMSHLKQVSRIVEESTLHQFLRFLSTENGINPGLYMYMYQLERNIYVSLSKLPPEIQKRVSALKEDSLAFPPEEFWTAGHELIQLILKSGYNEDYANEMEVPIRYLYLFLDINHLGYLPELADIWFQYVAENNLFHGSTVHSASRILNLFRDFAETGTPDFAKVYRKGITGISTLPDWCRIPMEGFVQERQKLKLDPRTVKDDIYFLLRFFAFLIQKGLASFAELTGRTIAEFNLYDLHGTTEGKNSCNCGIRKFLKYLYREGIITDCNLHLALGVAASPVETIVQILTDEEIQQARIYISNARTPVEIRDSAMFLLGVDMGIRGCDIVSLKLTDIDWKRQCIQFQQCKTDTETYNAMPTAVGNAIFRYLRDVRPKGIENEYVFVSLTSPYKRLSRCVCYGMLKRIFPNRKVPGSGFHVTRKTFSTNRLKNGTAPEQIANALGHSGTGSLTPYLSLDSKHMEECPLSLKSLNLMMKEGF